MSGSGDESPAIVDLSTQLVDEFRGRLDEALILTIAGDFDLTTSTEWDEARTVLLNLAENAVLEELSGFNHSGVPSTDLPSNVEALDLNGGDDQTSLTEGSQPQTLGSESSPPTASSSVVVEDSDLALFLNTESWSEDRKTAELTAMFPMLTILDITLTLRKTGDVGRAVDELLNIQGLEEAGLRQKGIDGFFNPEDTGSWGFRKSKKKNRSEGTDNGKQKIVVDYCLKPLPRSELEDSEIPTTTRSHPGLSVRPQLSTSSRPASYASLPSPSLASPRVSTSKSSKWQKVESKKKPRATGQKPESETPFSARSEARAGYAAAGQAARSGNLHRAYAGILAERASEATRNAHVLEHENWNTYVNRNRPEKNAIDLHGLPVLDGVRIALQMTLIWWEGFDEERVKKARQNPFTIITGMGYHSVGGVSRMRQHVYAALKRHGWKADTHDGLFLVNGKN